MKIGIESSAYVGRYGFEEGLRRMKAHGYECVDAQNFINTETPLFSMTDAEFDRQLLWEKDAYASAGIEIFQSHGPWRYPPQDYTEEDREERFEKMARSIHGTAVLGCKNFVIHPLMPWGADSDPEPQRRWDMNLEFFSRLCKVAEAEDVTICFENMPMTRISLSRPVEILEFVKTINHPLFKICLDTGHCAVFGESPADAVRLIGKEYLRVLHVHDNDGKNDRHWLPYNGVIDWADFSLALAEIGYEGTLSLETRAPARIPADILEPQEIALFHMGKQLANR